MTLTGTSAALKTEPAPHLRGVAARQSIEGELPRAITRAQEHLLRLQDKEGFWWAELEANTTLTSEYLYLMHMLDQVDPVKERKIVNELKAEQRPDGGFWIYYGGPSDLSTTAEAYIAWKLAGEDINAEHMRKAREFILANGGISKVRVFTKIHLALMGLWDFRGTPTLPAWVMMFPERFGMSIYQMSSWARSCVVPLVILMDRKPVFEPKRKIAIDELFAEKSKDLVRYDWPWRLDKLVSWDNFFIAVDKVLRLLEKSRFIPFRKIALKRAEKWILQRQDDEGDWGGIIPAMAYSLLALKALGYGKNHPTARKGWAAIERFGMESEDRFRLQSCVSPVWDTALAVWSLREAGLPEDHPALRKGARWLLDKQMHHYGDWSVKNPKGMPGGWSFEFYNRYYPDCDDSSAAILSLREIDLGKENAFRDESLERARQWVLSMQCKDGGWGAFDINNNQQLWNKIPFADHKAMLDPNTPDLTGRVIEMLGTTGRDLSDPAVARAVDYLLKTQEKDGSWYGRWGVNYVYGTWAVLCGLRKVGVPTHHPAVQKGAAFLKRVQNEDGGWGEHCTSYNEKRFVPSTSTASQTAWAVMGLLAAGEAQSPEAAAGTAWILRRQEEDGHWEEREFTGTGFPGHFYIRYHLYRDCFPAMALGQFARAQQGKL